MRVPQKITLTKREQLALENWSKSRKGAVRKAERAKIVLLAAAGMSNQGIATKMAIKPQPVGRWRSRFAELRLVGLYLNPPEKALAPSVNEQSQIQALDRTQPGLPMVRGRCGTMTHDYKRNGTTTLFAAIDMTRGKVIA